MNRKDGGGLIGSAGAQEDFLAGCGVFAHLAPLGALGSASAQVDTERSRAPVRSQQGRGRKLPTFQVQNTLRSRAPEDSTSHEICDVDWAADVARFIALIPNESLRPTLTDLYEETAAFIEFEQNRSRAQAEQQAFGLLIFHAMRHGVGGELQ